MLKEYHVWDGLFSPVFEKKYRVTEEMLLAANQNTIGKDKKLALSYAMQNVPGLYESYFEGILARGYEITGDITPSYCALGAESLALIKRRLTSFGFDIKIIMLMRDPFERVWSALRMGRRNMIARGADEAKFAPEEDRLLKIYDAPNMVAQTNYKFAVEALEKVFEPEQIFYALYEELFERHTLERLGSFLDIPVKEEHVQVRVNVSKKEASVSEQTVKQICGYYREIYDFCNARFPKTQDVWRSPDGQ